MLKKIILIFKNQFKNYLYFSYMFYKNKIYDKINELMNKDLNIKDNLLLKLNYFKFKFDESLMSEFINNLCDYYYILLDKYNNIKISQNLLEKDSQLLLKKIEQKEEKIEDLNYQLEEINNMIYNINSKKKSIFDSIKEDNDLQIYIKKKKIIEEDIIKIKNKNEENEKELIYFYDIENSFLLKKITNTKIVIFWLLEIINNKKIDNNILNRAKKICSLDINNYNNNYYYYIYIFVFFSFIIYYEYNRPVLQICLV